MDKLIKTIRSAADIRRYHTSRVIGEQTIGHHSFNVAMLVRVITNNEAGADLIKAALDHDIPELATGDIPAPTKWLSPKIAEALYELDSQFHSAHGNFFTEAHHLTEDEARVLSIADMLELVLFCIEQREMGNTHLLSVETNGKKALGKKPRPNNFEWNSNITSLLSTVGVYQP